MLDVLGKLPFPGSGWIMPVVLGFMCTPGLPAQEAKPPPPPLAEPVLSDAALEAGLVSLGKLLLPDPALKPVYGRIKQEDQSPMAQRGGNFSELIEGAPDAPTLASNAWLLRQVERDGRELNETTDGLRLWETTPEAVEGDIYSQISWEPTPSGTAGKDATAIADWVRAQMLKLQSRGEDESPLSGIPGLHDTYTVSRPRPYLAWAALFYRGGEKSAAVNLARATLERLDPAARESELTAIVRNVAERQYNATLDAFGKTGDWVALERDLNALITRFARGWPDRVAAQVLLLKVQAQIQAGAAAKPITLPAELAKAYPWAGQDLAAWFQRLEKQEASPDLGSAYTDRELIGWHPMAHRSEETPLWTLPSLAKGEPATQFPESRGLQAVPVLAALLTDTTLIAVVPAADSGSSYQRGLMRFQGDVFELVNEDGAATREKLEAAYLDMRRPQTRAELAEVLLLAALPSSLQSTLHELDDPAGKRDEILNWHRQVKDLDESQLALRYLADDGIHEPWAGSVVDFLAASTDAKIIAELEEILLNSVETGYGGQDQFIPYLSARGEAGRPFLERAKKKMLEASAEQIAQNPDYKQYVESAIKTMERALRTKGSGALDEMLDELVNGEADVQEIHELLMPSLAKLKGPEVVSKLLPRMAATKDMEVRDYFLRLLDSYLPKQGTEAEKRQVLTDYRANWESLLYVLREPGEETPVWLPLVACILQLDPAAGPGYAETFNQRWAALYNADDEAATQAGLKRAQALLAGENPPPLPDPATVPAARRAAIVTELSAVPADEVIAKLKSYPLEEIAAVQEHLAELKDWPASIRSAGNRVEQIAALEVADPATWDAWKGREIDTATLQELSRQIAGEAKDRSLNVQLTGYGILSGWQLHVRGEPEQAQYSGNVGDHYQYAMENDPIPPTATAVSLVQCEMSGMDSSGAIARLGRSPVFLDQDIAPKVPEGAPEDLDKTGRAAQTMKTFWDRLKEAEKAQGQPWRGRFFQDSAPAAWLREETATPDIPF